MTVYSAHTYTQADPRLPQHIAYIYEILHCNHFIILSNATAYETTTIANCFYPSCLAINDFAVQADMVAVETSIDVGNIL